MILNLVRVMLEVFGQELDRIVAHGFGSVVSQRGQGYVVGYCCHVLF